MHAYTLIRSKRKTIAIHITRDATVEVRAPLRAPLSAINAFVDEREDWITSHLAQRRERLADRAAFTLAYGDMLPLCGRELPLRADDGKYAGCDGESFFVPSGMPPEHIKRAVVMAYKNVAKGLLDMKAAYFAELMGVAPSGLKINSAKSRWGSCSTGGRLNFSWRLVMADEDTVDYVVVHELAHIREHNHSARFWSVVGSVIPDYKQRRARLRELADKLSREDWD